MVKNSLIRPYLSLFPERGGMGGLPLDSHDFRHVCCVFWGKHVKQFAGVSCEDGAGTGFSLSLKSRSLYQ